MLSISDEVAEIAETLYVDILPPLKKWEYVKENQEPMIRQPIKGKKKKPISKKKTLQAIYPYGTSKLERDFAHEFLDKNGIVYIYQFRAHDIGRYFDFAIVENQKSQYITEQKAGLTSISQEGQHYKIDFLIEVDGGYFHGDPRVTKGNLNKLQERNKVADGIKEKWASLNCIPLVRFWEYDIRHNPKKVLRELKKYIKLEKPKPIPHHLKKLNERKNIHTIGRG